MTAPIKPKTPLGSRLRSWRKARGWDQVQFAHKVGTRQSTISEWETGRVKPSPMAVKLLKLLGFKS